MLELSLWVVGVVVCIVGALYIMAVNAPFLEDDSDVRSNDS